MSNSVVVELFDTAKRGNGRLRRLGFIERKREKDTKSSDETRSSDDGLLYNEHL